jgi:predicted acylesterase/phospholipase RssA
MSPGSTPDLKIRDAIRASCLIPLIFTSPMIDDKRDCDGGLLAYYPISFVDEFPEDGKIAVLVLPDDNREDVQDVLAYTARVIRLVCTYHQLQAVKQEPWILSCKASDGMGVVIPDPTAMVVDFGRGCEEARAYVRKKYKCKRE